MRCGGGSGPLRACGGAVGLLGQPRRGACQPAPGTGARPCCAFTPAAKPAAYPVPPPAVSPAGELAVFMEWVDQHRKIGVFTNADTPADALVARKNGAQGIGLVRTGAPLGPNTARSSGAGVRLQAQLLACLAAPARRALTAPPPLPLCPHLPRSFRAHVLRDRGAHRRRAPHDCRRGADGGGHQVGRRRSAAVCGCLVGRSVACRRRLLVSSSQGAACPCPPELPPPVPAPRPAAAPPMRWPRSRSSSGRTLRASSPPWTACPVRPAASCPLLCLSASCPASLQCCAVGQ